MKRPENSIMTVGELAAFLRCHPTTVYRMLRDQRIPAFKVGSDWRFNRDTIDQWVASRSNMLTYETEKRIRAVAVR